jgi:hypothetical protein
VSFDGAQFREQAFFESMEAAQVSFSTGLQPVRFLRGVSFIGASLTRVSYFMYAEFSGESFFDGAQFFNDVAFSGAQFRAGSNTRFVNARFKGEGSFPGATMEGNIRFNGAVFEQAASFENAVFKGPVDFRDADIRLLSFCTDEKSGNHTLFFAPLDLRNMKFERIRVNWPQMLDRMQPYDRQPHAQFEKYFRLIGEDEIADKVYYRWRRIEGDRLTPLGLRWWWDRGYRYLAGYGVRIWPLVFIPVLLLVVGTNIFLQPCAVTKTADKGKSSVEISPSEVGTFNIVDSFALSLRLMLHLDLPAGSAWHPSRNAVVMHGKELPIRYSTYATIHMLLAWFVIPFVAATITDRLRRRTRG